MHVTTIKNEDILATEEHIIPKNSERLHHIVHLPPVGLAPCITQYWFAQRCHSDSMCLPSVSHFLALIFSLSPTYWPSFWMVCPLVSLGQSTILHLQSSVFLTTSSSSLLMQLRAQSSFSQTFLRVNLNILASCPLCPPHLVNTYGWISAVLLLDIPLGGWVGLIKNQRLNHRSLLLLHDLQPHSCLHHG